MFLFVIIGQLFEGILEADECSEGGLLKNVLIDGYARCGSKYMVFSCGWEKVLSRLVF